MFFYTFLIIQNTTATGLISYTTPSKTNNLVEVEYVKPISNSLLQKWSNECINQPALLQLAIPQCR